jgi:hypothetical protein
MIKVWAILLLGVAVLFMGCGKKEEPKVQAPVQAPPPAPSVASITFAKGVDVNWTAVTPTTEFKPSDRINVTIRTENIVPGNTLLVRWMFLGTQQLVKADSVVLKEGGMNNSAFFIERAKGFPLGEYRLVAFLNGMPVKTGGFMVR